MTKQEKYSNADLLGRLKVIYALQMANPDLEITSMPISSRYDLKVQNPKRGTINYLEIKDRDVEEKQYNNAFLNIEKYEALSGYGENFYYVNIYKDNIIDFWTPVTMPKTGITEGEWWIRKSTVENAPKQKQRRFCLNFNDKAYQMKNNLDIDVKQPNS